MGKILVAIQDGIEVIKFVGDVRVILGPTISRLLNNIGTDESVKSIVIDLRETTSIDSTSLGLLAKIALKSNQLFGSKPILVSTDDDVNRVIASMGFSQVFVLVNQMPTDCCPEGELPTEVASEDVMRDQVLEAHKVLMSLNEKNFDSFCDLVDALEKEKSACQSGVAAESPAIKRAAR